VWNKPRRVFALHREVVRWVVAPFEGKGADEGRCYAAAHVARTRKAGAWRYRQRTMIMAAQANGETGRRHGERYEEKPPPVLTSASSTVRARWRRKAQVASSR